MEQKCDDAYAREQSDWLVNRRNDRYADEANGDATLPKQEYWTTADFCKQSDGRDRTKQVEASDKEYSLTSVNSSI